LPRLTLFRLHVVPRHQHHYYPFFLLQGPEVHTGLVAGPRSYNQLLTQFRSEPKKPDSQRTTQEFITLETDKAPFPSTPLLARSLHRGLNCTALHSCCIFLNNAESIVYFLPGDKCSCISFMFYCCNELPLTWWLKQLKYIFLQTLTQVLLG
jgi:hypothetical protein